MTVVNFCTVFTEYFNSSNVLQTCPNSKVISSRSTSDNRRTIIEKMENVYVQINGTLFFGEFSKSLTSKREAVGA